jgi:hypothetical protein
MNLVEEILREHTKKQKDKIVSYVGHNPKRFSELVDIFLQGPSLVTQRAAWPISYCIEQYPDLLKPHFRKILTQLGKKNIHDSVKRNILQMLQFVRVPKAWQGITADLCLTFLADAKEPVAIRVFAMNVLANIASEVPELKNELIPLIEDQLPYSSAGFISRGSKVLKQLKQ